MIKKDCKYCSKPKKVESNKKTRVNRALIITIHEVLDQIEAEIQLKKQLTA
jgi:hypothetical protein